MASGEERGEKETELAGIQNGARGEGLGDLTKRARAGGRTGVGRCLLRRISLFGVISMMNSQCVGLRYRCSLSSPVSSERAVRASRFPSFYPTSSYSRLLPVFSFSCFGFCRRRRHRRSFPPSWLRSFRLACPQLQNISSTPPAASLPRGEDLILHTKQI